MSNLNDPCLEHSMHQENVGGALPGDHTLAGNLPLCPTEDRKIVIQRCISSHDWSDTSSVANIFPAKHTV